MQLQWLTYILTYQAGAR